MSSNNLNDKGSHKDYGTENGRAGDETYAGKKRLFKILGIIGFVIVFFFILICIIGSTTCCIVKTTIFIYFIPFGLLYLVCATLEFLSGKYFNNKLILVLSVVAFLTVIPSCIFGIFNIYILDRLRKKQTIQGSEKVLSVVLILIGGFLSVVRFVTAIISAFNACRILCSPRTKQLFASTDKE